MKGEEGELFGLANLLRLTTERILSKEIVEEAHKKEIEYKIQMKNFDDQISSNGEVGVSHLFDEYGFIIPVLNYSRDEIIDLDNLQSAILKNSILYLFTKLDNWHYLGIILTYLPFKILELFILIITNKL